MPIPRKIPQSVEARKIMEQFISDYYPYILKATGACWKLKVKHSPLNISYDDFLQDVLIALLTRTTPYSKTRARSSAYSLINLVVATVYAKKIRRLDNVLRKDIMDNNFNRVYIDDEDDVYHYLIEHNELYLLEDGDEKEDL